MTTDYYELLGVSQDASTDNIKKAYRQQALKYHPDRNPGDKEAEEHFKVISNAYQVLSDPEKRGLYDRYGPEGVSRSGFSGFTDVQDIFSSFGDLFGDVFGGLGGFRSQRSRGADLEVDLTLTFLEAAEGCERDVSVTRRVACGHCEGSGSAPGSSPVICPICKGKGQVVHSQGFFMISSTCPQCQGAGSKISDPCQECEGSGLQKKEDKLQVSIPAGVEQGQTLRLLGKGEVSSSGIAGNLYVNILVEEDERFHREGADLFTDITLSYPMAALGGKVTIPLLKGEKKITVEPGTQAGDTMVLRGAGVAHLNGRGRGDQILRFSLDVPTQLSSKAKELLRELSTELGEEVSEKKGLFGRFQKSKRK